MVILSCREGEAVEHLSGLRPGSPIEIALTSCAVETEVLRTQPPRLWVRRPRGPGAALATAVQQVDRQRVRFQRPAPDPLAAGNQLTLRALVDGLAYWLQAEVIGEVEHDRERYLILHVRAAELRPRRHPSCLLAAQRAVFGPAPDQLAHQGTVTELDAEGLTLVASADVPWEEPLWFRIEGPMPEPAQARVTWKCWRRSTFRYELVVEPPPAGHHPYAICLRALYRQPQPPSQTG